jgi:hypothetical protein
MRKERKHQAEKECFRVDIFLRDTIAAPCCHSERSEESPALDVILNEVKNPPHIKDILEASGMMVGSMPVL